LTAGSERKRPNRLLVIARTLFGLALLAVVVAWLDPVEVFSSLKGVRRGPLALAFASQVAAKLVWTYRWQIILRANKIRRGFWDLLAIVHIGLFFATFLPTSMGGDVVRAYYTSRRPEESAVISYLTVFIERVLGMATFAGMAALAAAVALATESTPLPRQLLLSVVLLGAAIVGAGVLVFSWRGWVGLARKLPIPERWIDDLAEGLALFQRPETPRLAIVSSSVTLKLLAILLYILCGAALELDLSPTVYFLVVPAAVVSSMLPVTLNGLGIREGVMAGLLTAFGAPPAKAGAMAILGLAIITSFAIIGGVVYSFYRRPSRRESD
jgi:uncharacterized membrane protein YbhN (UPF0104 family)